MRHPLLPIPVDADLCFCSTAQEGAALGLLGLMTGISEQNWCAGWLLDLEFRLWDASAGMKFGQRLITEREATLLRLLSEESDGWWVWRDKPTFIRRAEWLQILARREHS
jgi:hypothetical protein